MSFSAFSKEYDLCVIGGGINGAGIARDAAGRGLSVLLVEAKDLAAATSSASTKLIHGGLRYLEYYEFGLVRSSLIERERLLTLAPHIIWPMNFILPHRPSMRPKWMIRAGLFLYDHLAPRRTLPASQSLSLEGLGLRPAFQDGFQYSDCWVDDARLVVLNAMSAQQKGATILTYTRCDKLVDSDAGWDVHLTDQASGEQGIIRARRVVNAAGSWVDGIVDESGIRGKRTPTLRLIKGSHIIVRNAFDFKDSFLLQQEDGRIVFVIPYEGEYLLIGTTDEAYSGDVYACKISDQEVDYLCAAFHDYFDVQIIPKDIVWSYSGVRGLVDDGAEVSKSVTRDYKLHLHKSTRNPLLSVYGGKLTTYRVLAEKVMNKMMQQDMSWTASEALPGGDFDDFDDFIATVADSYQWISEKMLHRYARAYGRDMSIFLQDKNALDDLGLHFGDDVYQVEIDYMLQYEFAKTLDDMLWRRSKLGLHVSEQTLDRLKAYCDEKAVPYA